MLRSRPVQEIWQNASVICFDFDSTVIENESIGELAAFCGVQKEVDHL